MTNSSPKRLGGYFLKQKKPPLLHENSDGTAKEVYVLQQELTTKV